MEKTSPGIIYGKLSYLSTIALLRELGAPLRVGT